MPGLPDTILVHVVWTLTPGAPPLTNAVVERLAPYATRWAKTLGVTVWAVGGAGDELHLLLDAPVDRALQSVTNELQAATMRFGKDTLGINGLIWQSASYEGVGAHEKEARIGYIQTIAHPSSEETFPHEKKTESAAASETGADDDTMPEWLQEALAASKSRL